MPPRVTVLMPVFNQERFIDDAIRSVIEQDFAGLRAAHRHQIVATPGNAWINRSLVTIGAS